MSRNRAKKALQLEVAKIFGPLPVPRRLKADITKVMAKIVYRQHKQLPQLAQHLREYERLRLEFNRLGFTFYDPNQTSEPPAGPPDERPEPQDGL